MCRISTLLCSLTLLAFVSAGSTQPSGQPRDFFVGPGGEFFSTVPMRTSGVFLMGMSEVRKELGTSEAQNKQLDELVAAAQEQMRASFTVVNPQELDKLTDEQRRKHFDEARKKSDEANKQLEAKLSKILDVKQNERLGQLRLQREGPGAFNRPDFARQLGLQEEQQAKIRKVQEEVMGGFPRGPDERRKLEADVLSLLTPEQKNKLAELRGKEFKFPEGGPGGQGFFMGGPGGPMGQARKLVAQFDKDGDKRLNSEERLAAREFLKKNPAGGNRPGGPGMRMGPPGGFGGRNQEPPKPGARVSPADVKSYPEASLYEPTVLRTLFLDFENKDWEAELADFMRSDVEVPATLTVDGKKYPNVGVHFRGASSLFGVGTGYKRSLNLSLDFMNEKQRLYGSKTLNLLNAHDDASYLSTVLYSNIARQHIPAPRANLVKVVINGENWGVYCNAQQFDKEFVKENFKTTSGARWKVSGSPGGDGGLTYVGDKVEEYKRRYEIKSGDDAKSWQALIALCRTLNQTPPDRLEEALKPMLDIDSALWFLALDDALINNDGYWIRSSDYSLYRDPKGIFHLIPHDMNEAFRGAMGFGFGGPGGRGPGGPGGRPGGPAPGGPGQPPPGGTGGPPPGGPGGPPPKPGAGVMPRGAGFELDPLTGLEDARKPLRSKLLAVPNLKARYLEHVRTIADKSLDWKTLGPVVAQYRALIEKEVEADTHKLDSFAAFQKATADEPAAEPAAPGRRPEISLRTFADKRRAYLLNHPEIKRLATSTSGDPKKGGGQ